MTSEERPFKRIVNYFTGALAVFGAFSFVYTIPAKFAKEFGWSNTAKILLMVGLCVLFGTLFAVLWIVEVFRDWRQDRPLAGFNLSLAGMLARVGKRTLPVLPEKRRHKIVMAAGIGGACSYLEHIVANLRY